MNRLRLFTAIVLPPDVRQRIDYLAGRFVARIPEGTIRRIRPANYHITLQFLGDTDESAAGAIASCLAEAAQGIEKPIPLELRAIGAFPSASRPRTLWCGVHDPEGDLARFETRLGREIERAGVSFDRRSFRPHVTFGYVRKQSDARRRREIARAIAGVAADGQPRAETAFVAAEAALVSSTLGPGGSSYESIHVVRLGDRPG